MSRAFAGRVALSGLPLLGLLCALATGCGGSASETPWPVEPDNVDLGPIGEERAGDVPTSQPVSSVDTEMLDKNESPTATKKPRKRPDPDANLPPVEPLTP